MSNPPIYEEFKKTVGKTSVRSVVYVRTQCKNCNSIIEYGKHHHKTHKGYCGKCRATERALELIGQKFGHLTVVKRVENSKVGQSKWLCQCSCGSRTIVGGAQLNTGHTKSCGCFHGLNAKEYIKSKVKVTEDGKWLWQGCFFKGGYYKYGQAMWKGEHWRAHRLSYTVFVGDIPEGMYVCHKNDCPQDVNPENLFLSDHDGNMSDMVEKGRASRGSKNFNAKLNEKQVKEIKKLLSEGGVCNHIAKLYNVNFSTIARIRDGKTWKHVTKY